MRKLSTLLMAGAAFASFTGCGATGARPTTSDGSTGVSTTTGHTTTVTIAAAGAFLTPGRRGMLCYLSSGSITCGVNRVPRPWRRYLEVTLNADGKLTTCRGVRCLSNYGGAPIPALTVGQSATIGPFTCVAEEARVGCFVKKSHRGFMLHASGVLRRGWIGLMSIVGT